MRKRLTQFVLLVALVVLGTGAAQGASGPGVFYVTNNPQYWQYAISGTTSDPGFQLWVPSKGEGYVQTGVLGVKWLSISMGSGGPLFLVYDAPADSDKAAQAAQTDAIDQWTSLLHNTKVTANQSITTSKKIDALYYQLDGTDAAGKGAFVKWVGFRKDGRVVGLIMVCRTADYSGDTHQYWLQMVNTFDWK